MNLLLIEPDELPAGAGALTLTGRRADHVREILGAVPGDTLRAGILGRSVGQAELLALDAGGLHLVYTPSAPPGAPPTLDLIVALPRPPTLKKILQQGAALGLGRLCLVRAARVEKSFFQSPQLQPEKVREDLCLGLEQARDVTVPEVEIWDRFRPFVEERLPALLGPGRVGLLAHPEGGEGLWARRGELLAAERVVVAIGPEGGWVPSEVERLRGAGLVPVDMGPRILRVETAVVALMAQVALLRGAGASGAGAGP